MSNQFCYASKPGAEHRNTSRKRLIYDYGPRLEPLRWYCQKIVRCQNLDNLSVWNGRQEAYGTTAYALLQCFRIISGQFSLGNSVHIKCNVRRYERHRIEQ